MGESKGVQWISLGGGEGEFYIETERQGVCVRRTLHTPARKYRLSLKLPGGNVESMAFHIEKKSFFYRAFDSDGGFVLVDHRV